VVHLRIAVAEQRHVQQRATILVAITSQIERLGDGRYGIELALLC
jgi:hypothetical protein